MPSRIVQDWSDALSKNASPNILLQLQAAARADEQIAGDFRNNVVAPFLRGEDGAAAKMQPPELVPWLYRRASPDEATAVMSRQAAALIRIQRRLHASDAASNKLARRPATS